MDVGITILVILSLVIVTQVIFQGHERRKQHEQLMRRLDELVGKRHE